MDETIHRRIFQATELRVAGEGAKRMIAGHAAVYDVESDPIGGWFIEIVRPGAFTNTLKTADVRCLFNHDQNQVLGRSAAKTLRLFDETKGLRIECDPPDTTNAGDVLKLIARGDVTQMSFSFRTLKDRWTFAHEPGKLDVRELLEVELFDVAPVTFPAYPQTDVGLRGQAVLKAVWEEARRAHAVASRSRARAAELALAEAES